MRPGFTGAAVDRADALRLDEARLAELIADEAALLLRLSGFNPELDDEGRLLWDSPAGTRSAGEFIFLGLRGEVPLFAPLVSGEAGQPAWSVFPLLNRMAAEDAAIWGAARSLLEWHGRHAFCGRCGHGTDVFRAGWGRRCPNCGLEHFPRVDPVVIMLAEYQGKVLLARQPRYPPGRYSALAGFVEPGESIEEAVAREFAEEAGILVTDIDYVASQPWPFPGQLMIACVARAASDAVILDTNELEHAIWVDRAGVVAALAGDPDAPFGAPPDYAIANTLMRHWLHSRDERLAQPGDAP
jgi:NAD+ diphosphatase